jgi:hypothetical protein
VSTLLDRNVGRLELPERRLWLPGSTTPQPVGYQAIVTVAVRDGRTGRKTHAAYGAGVVCRDGLAARWDADDGLQRQFQSVEAMLAEMARRVRLAYTHNERTQNGARMISKGFWGTSASPTDSTVGTPTRICLANASITATYTDQVLGQSSTATNPNEATTNGMARTGALTPSGLTDATSFDGQYQLTLSNVFTDTTAASTIYAAGLVDAASTTGGAFNLFAEATFASATLQINDTLTVTWTCKF